MEELLVKYSFGECTQEELAQVEKLFDQNPELRFEHETMLKVDALMTTGFKPNKLESEFSNKLAAALNIALKPAPIINLEAEASKQSWNDYLLPILFALASLGVIMVYGFSDLSVNPSTSYIWSSYSQPVLFGSICLLGLFLFDQILERKQGHKPFLLSL